MLHRLASAPFFYRFSTRLWPWCAAFSLPLLLGGAVWALLFAPPDAVQGHSYRIVFVHVPLAFFALGNYLLMTVAALVVLVWRLKLAEAALYAAAPVGAWLSLGAILTGAIWARPTWGAWWVWDPRVTSMVVLLFIYIGITALRRAYSNPGTAVRACAILVLIGSVDLVIVHKSVDWWYSLHQGATFKLGAKPAMAPEMWRPLLLIGIGASGQYAAVLLLWMRNEVLLRAGGTRWVAGLLRPGAN